MQGTPNAETERGRAMRRPWAFILIPTVCVLAMSAAACLAERVTFEDAGLSFELFGSGFSHMQTDRMGEDITSVGLMKRPGWVCVFSKTTAFSDAERAQVKAKLRAHASTK
jgi:hypothetical protein